MVGRRLLGVGGGGAGAGPAGDGGRRWWRKRHDVCGVEGVFADGEGGEGRRGGEQQVCTQAVVRVDRGGGGEGDFLRGREGGGGEVVARGGGDVHCGGGRRQVRWLVRVYLEVLGGRTVVGVASVSGGPVDG